MNDILLGEVKVTHDDLLDEVGCLGFRQTLLDEFAKVRLTQLSDDVGVVFGRVHFVETEYVREVFEFLEHLDLALEQDFVNLVFEETQVNHLDCHILVGLILATSVDLAGVAFPDDVVESVAVALYFLSREIACHALCS